MSVMKTHTVLLQETLPQTLLHLTKIKIDPIMVLVGINDRWVEMEIDTGAAVSLISRIVFDRH